MSATSGITVSPELATAFSSAVDSGSVRFLKISIRNESLVAEDSVPPQGTLQEDLAGLASIIDDNVPAYILAKLDDSPGWLAIFYVPDTAKVKDKMLYASTRANLTKSLGSTHFTDSIFANSKDDVTPDAYAKHVAHMNAPKPMTEREKEIAATKAAERSAGGSHYDGSRARHNPLESHPIGFQWEPAAENALTELATGEGGFLVVLSIGGSENLKLHSSSECSPETLSSLIPSSEPSFSFFAWPQTITSPPRREIVFIYSCPSGSPVKNRMLYSSGAISTYRTGKAYLGVAARYLAERKIETSDPKELDEDFLKAELLLNSPSTSGAATPTNDEAKKAFARPRGPARSAKR